MTDLTPEQRARAIAALRADAIAQCRALGCTCDPEPVMSLTDRGLGRHDLPAWMSEHDSDCMLERNHQRRRAADTN